MPSVTHDLAKSNAPRSADGWIWVGRAAIAIAIAVVLTRSTVLEYLRDPFQITPGSPQVARSPGASTILLLDLLAAVPALLVAVRAVFDRAFVLRRSWGNVVMALLAAWMASSVLRADDRFAATADAANICSALSLLWATQQLIRSWRQVRIVAAVAFGVLLICAAHGVIDRLVELPARQESFQKNLPAMLKSMAIEPGTFEANRLLQKISSGELLGFGASINTFAAVMVMAGVVSAGAVIQRLKDREEPIAAVATIVLLAGCAVVLKWTDCRAAYATPVLAAMGFIAIAVAGRWLRAHRREVFGLTLLAVVAGTAFLIHHGLKTGTLFHDSLNFRWRYWVGSWGVWWEHPWLGVGLDGFGLHYLAHRLAEASEEIRDPHNFLVRAFCELGLIGGLLTLLWTIKAIWDMTRPAEWLTLISSDSAAHASPGQTATFSASKAVDYSTARSHPAPGEPGMSDLGKIAIVCIAGMLLATIVSLDFAWIDWNAAIEVLKRLLYVCLTVIGGALIALRSMQRQQIDDRPAPWIRAGLTISVLVFLIHNLIDFAMFESSAMFFAAWIAGAAWGVGLDDRVAERRPITIVRAVLMGGAWLLAAVTAAPILLAETSAADAANLLRQSQFIPAGRAYEQAFEQYPGNADYAYNAAMSLAQSPEQDNAQIRKLLNGAIASNPMSPKYFRVRAESNLSHAGVPAYEIVADYVDALRIDPNSVDIRLEYAGVLTRLNRLRDAKQQYLLALDFNDRLDAAEPKRLSANKIAELREKISQLGG